MKIFNTYWKQEFPNLLPFGYELRHHFPERWFRIHSLPKSKRYADTEEEYQIIFDRQNQLFDAIFGEGTKIIIVFGLCTNDITNDNYNNIFDYNKFEKVNSIDLNQFQPENYDENIFLDIYTKIDKWHKNSYNKILKAIADDEIRMLFICPSKNRVVVPYDGGVDIIVENETARDKFKSKYIKWLSYREDGL
ncbi:MAG: hypothetical protein KAH20_15255 [Methylococcales bacterium]|nr:hypothetical protein [Methylococcales bacterium]